MKLTPIAQWSWGYDAKGRLTVNLGQVTEHGIQKLMLITKFHYNDLLRSPDDCELFCLEDAEYLAAFQDGLRAIRMSSGVCLDLGLNAVACARFVRQNGDVSAHFRSYPQRFYPERGDVVTLCTEENQMMDCILLNELDDDDLANLMMVNEGFTTSRGRRFKLCDMVRVRPEMICPFRVLCQPPTRPRYA